MNYTLTYTRTPIHRDTPHYWIFHTTVLLPNLFQSWAETSELLGQISTSELDPQSCVLVLSLVLFCPFVHVRMYVSVCSFPLFVFNVLAGGRFL